MHHKHATKKIVLSFFTGLCAFVVLRFAVIPAYREYGLLKDTIELKERKIIQCLDILRKGTLETAHLDELQHAGLGSGCEELFKGETPSVIAAEIQKLIRDTAQGCHLEISRIVVLKPDDNSPVASIPIQVQFNSDIQRLSCFLAGLYSHPKMITVDKLQSKSRASRSRRRSKDFSVWVNMVICGYRRNDESV